MKLNPLKENLEGKRVVVVDDTIVRGTTQRTLTQMLREAGATEVHLRISAPPVMWSCFYGIDTGVRSELLAANLDLEEIRDYLKVDSLAYLDPRPPDRRHRHAPERLLRRLLHRRLPGRDPGVAVQGRARGAGRARRRSAAASPPPSPSAAGSPACGRSALGQLDFDR